MSKKIFDGSKSRFRLIVMTIIRVMLLVAIYIAIIDERNLVLLMGLLGLFTTFIPWICHYVFRKKIPAEFELIVILFIYGLLLFASIRGFKEYWLWDIMINLGASIALSLIGLTIVSVLENEDLLDSNAFIVAFFAFCFAFTLGGLWEILEFLLDTTFGFGLQYGGLQDTMSDLLINAFGAFITSLAGYHYLKKGRKSLVSPFISGFMKRNLRFFRTKNYLEYQSQSIRRLISSGEGPQLEFKSTLRKNLHTGTYDKHIGHATLKTITAYLNSSGGTLLIGVDDKGNVTGIQADEFENNDKLQVYLTSLLRNHLGNRFLPFIDFELYPLEDAHVLRIDCKPSPKRVFLKWNGEEEFYVRHGATTLKLTGNDLLEYVDHHFST